LHAHWQRNPRFILLDEPFAGIDPIAVIEIQRIIGFLKARGMGVLITDHNVRETLGICDHACIISDGRVLAQGTPREIMSRTPMCDVCISVSISECDAGLAMKQGLITSRLSASGAHAAVAAVDPTVPTLDFRIEPRDRANARREPVSRQRF
jgi:ABC-type multidrug transport system ATPase subunit